VALPVVAAGQSFFVRTLASHGQHVNVVPDGTLSVGLRDESNRHSERIASRAARTVATRRVAVVPGSRSIRLVFNLGRAPCRVWSRNWSEPTDGEKFTMMMMMMHARRTANDIRWPRYDWFCGKLQTAVGYAVGSVFGICPDTDVWLYVLYVLCRVEFIHVGRVLSMEPGSETFVFLD